MLNRCLTCSRCHDASYILIDSTYLKAANKNYSLILNWFYTNNSRKHDALKRKRHKCRVKYFNQYKITIIPFECIKFIVLQKHVFSQKWNDIETFKILGNNLNLYGYNHNVTKFNLCAIILINGVSFHVQKLPSHQKLLRWISTSFLTWFITGSIRWGTLDKTFIENSF